MGNVLNATEGVKANDLDSSCETTMFSVSVATSKNNLKEEGFHRTTTMRDEVDMNVSSAQNCYHEPFNEESHRSRYSMGGPINPLQAGSSSQPPINIDRGYNHTDRNRGYNLDYNESPQHYSDPSTDGDSMASDAYKILLQKDYLSHRNEPKATSQHFARRLPSVPVQEEEPVSCTTTASLEINLDFTLHVGKLVVYLKKVNLGLAFIEELFGEVNRLRGRIKCALLMPAKTQRCASSSFEASQADDNGNMTAELDDVFVYYLFPRHQIDGMALQFKLCGTKALFREVVMAESFVRLGEIRLTSEMLPVSVTFVDLGSGRFSEHHQKQGRKAVLVPKSGKLEVLLSLQYIAQTSSLIIDIKQSTRLGKLRDIMSREIILQAEIISSTCECLQRKTTFLKMTIDNPGCNKPFEFNLGQDQLFVHTLMLSVSYSASRWSPQEKIGWISFGRHCSGQLEASHWDDMIRKSALHEPAIQWHCLCEHQNTSGNPFTRILK